MFIDARRQHPPKNGWYKTRMDYHDGVPPKDKYRLFENGRWYFYLTILKRPASSPFATTADHCATWEFSSNPKQFEEIKNEA